jgi:uncharacterized protein YhaN
VKIIELRLTAFGPFTGRILDLSKGNPGLHVIFGPNEAGKSSALRALHALLYGIPAQTDDAFLHPYAELRVGARLRHSSGTEIEFSRRKANKGSLLGPGDARLEENSLDRFLGGVGPDQFKIFWGIDHARLVDGGREILDGRGEIGTSLFAAGSGASHLGALRKKIDEEAADLFVPRGHNRAVNVAVGRLRDLRREQRDSAVSAEEWARQDAASRDAAERINKLTNDARELARQKSRLERAKRVLPLLAERGELRGRLANLKDVIRLAPDFPKRRIDAEAALRTSERNREQDAADAQKHLTLIEQLGATPALAAESDAVNTLHERLGIHRKALRDRPRLVGQRGEQLELATRLLAELRPDLSVDGSEPLRVFVGRRARIQKLASERERLEERQETVRDQLTDAQKEFAARARDTAQLPPERDSEDLVAAIEESRRGGDAETQRLKLSRSINRISEQRDAVIERLRLSKGAVDRFSELRVPTAATIVRFERKAQEIEAEIRTAKTERQRIERTMRELNAKIETAHTKRAVPTEADLDAARSRRDDAFGLLRDHWEKKRDVTTEARALLGKGKLIDLYPDAVIEADRVADRLRSEADRVAELAQQIEERERLSKELGEADQQDDVHAKAIKDFDVEWRAVWKSVLDDAPPIHDARAWCEEFKRLVERAQELVEIRQQCADLEEWIDKQTKSLNAAVRALESTKHPAEGLSSAIASADKLRQRIENDARSLKEHARATRDAEHAILDANAAIESAQMDLDGWQDRWREATHGLVDGGPPAPDDALVALDRVDGLFRALDDAAKYAARIAGIDRDAEDFQANVRALAVRLAESEAIPIGSEDTWVEGLHGRLAVVIKEDERRRQANARLEEIRKRVNDDDDAIKAAREALAALRDEAACGVDGDLATAEQRSDEVHKCTTGIERVENEIVRNGDGASIAEILTETVDVDRDAIDPRLTAINVELQGIEDELALVRDAKAAAQAELRRMEGPSVAAEKAEEVQATLARLRDDVLRHARLRVAGTLLARRIDDYRRKNQVPLLQRAAVLFHEMTLGTFDRLEADVEEDRPILVGVRSADGRRVPAHGMSEGTRDQLFFALRLAAVEASCAASEPMPLVVDDVLVQFDDDRGAAALRALADVAKRTQVVLFTHHRQVRECAEALAATADVIVHGL